jgi:YD repeat-containing protein
VPGGQCNAVPLEIAQENPLGERTSFTYDEWGNRIEKDAPAETTYYTWDEDSRLVAAEPPAGVTTLVYNADGLRVGKETPSESRKFIYDFRKLLQETDGADDHRVRCPGHSGRSRFERHWVRIRVTADALADRPAWWKDR